MLTGVLTSSKEMRNTFQVVSTTYNNEDIKEQNIFVKGENLLCGWSVGGVGRVEMGINRKTA